MKKEENFETIDFIIDSEEQEVFKKVLIKGYRTVWIYIDDKGKQKTQRTHYCNISTESKFLNLGECWDGSVFQSVKNAMNEARWFINNRAELYGWI